MRHVNVRVFADRVVEPAETFTVRLSQPVATRISDASAVVTIVDDD